MAMKAAASLSFQARLATQLLSCGRSKVWLDPDNKEAISRAKTDEDVRELIAAGIITRRPFRVREAQSGVKAHKHQKYQMRRHYWDKQRESANIHNPTFRDNKLAPEVLQEYLTQKEQLAEKSVSSKSYRRQMMEYQRTLG